MLNQQRMAAAAVGSTDGAGHRHPDFLSNLAKGLTRTPWPRLAREQLFTENQQSNNLGHPTGAMHGIAAQHSITTIT